MKNNKIYSCLMYVNLLGMIFLISLSVKPVKSFAKETITNTYTVKSSSNPYENQYLSYSTYNEKTKHYYMLRSYLELMEKNGGGTLILEKGTYNITNNLYIPSNVTIKLKNGVKIQKSFDTGTEKLTPSKSLFLLIAPSKSGITDAVSKYKGEKNISIIGEGTAIIDLKYVQDSVGIVMGHNSNVNLEGITFQKMYGGSFIKIGASQDVVIQNNTFQKHKDSSGNCREAVSLEVPDVNTHGFYYGFSKNDNTPNKNITIKNNSFLKLERAIGSTKYTEDVYQENIQILNNTISETDSHAIRIINWSKPIIKDNKFNNILGEDGSLKGIIINGSINPTVTNNTFTKVGRPIQISPCKNGNYGSEYAATTNIISEENKKEMLSNSLIDMKEYFIRYNKTYNEFILDTEKWLLTDDSIKDYRITYKSEPFQNLFTNFSTYNKATKQYYMIRSYLEQLERVGGGTLTFEAGTYVITNVLYIPSNVTIYFEDGVIIKKGTAIREEDNMDSAKSIFQLIAPSKSRSEGIYGGYEGETNISFIGKGKAVIDLNYVEDSIGILMGHNTNVTIKGITFQNMCGGHFIEMDASKNVVVENNKFLNSKPSYSGMKEGINIDTPDKNTNGFNVIWTNYDCTPNKDITIQNNEFDKLERAIGTHKYSENKYHDNVQILNNKISNTASDGIRIINWSNAVIKGNEIKMVAGGQGNDRAILASGVKNPIITDNTFIDVPRPIQIMPWKNNEGGSQYGITYNEVSNDNINAMLNNRLIRVLETFIRINKTYSVFDSNTEKYYYSGEYVQY